MFNYLLDRYPDNYHGYLIRTDYRIGVQIQLCLSDPDFSEYDRAMTALSLLYGNGIPDDIQLALNGIAWFMQCGTENVQNVDDSNEPELYSFEFDSGRLVTGFRKTFGIDITREKLHWFEFVVMLSELRDTAFSDVLEIRRTDESEIDKKKLSEFRKMKRRFAIPARESQEDLERQDAFLAEVKAAQKRRKEV